MKKSILSVSVYTSPEPAFFVNSFVVETETGVFVVDTQFLISEARKLKQKIEQAEKPLLGIVVTHPHPDHFNGAVVLSENINVPIYATQKTLDGIRQSESGKREFWKKSYGDDYPDSTAFPNQIVASKQEFQIGGVVALIDELGAGESSNNAVVYFPADKILIASDLLYQKTHPWLAESRSQAWLKQLNYLKQNYSDAAAVYAGHGAPGDQNSFDEQIEYINYFRDLVGENLSPDGSVSKAAQKQIVETVKNRYQNYPLEFLIEGNIDGIARELLEQSKGA